MRGGQRKNPCNPNLSIIHAADTICIAYPRGVLRSVKILAQKSFRSSRISCFYGRSGFPVVPVIALSLVLLLLFSYRCVAYLLEPASLLLSLTPCSCCSIKKSNILDSRAQKGLQRDVVYLGWPIAPSCEPKCGGGGSCGDSTLFLLGT